MIQHTLGVFWHHYNIKIAMTLGIVREKFDLQKKLSFSFLFWCLNGLFIHIYALLDN